MAQGNYEEFESSSLFCPHCRRAQPVRKKLLLILPSGNKYDYVCQGCGQPVGGKVDDNRDAFGRVARPEQPPRRS